MYTVVTHDGGFHADDVFGVATLQLKFGIEAIQVVRTRDQAQIDSGDIVLDVGGIYDVEKMRFDHHQPGAPVRDNGIPYAAFGLVWKTFGVDICGSELIAEKIDENIIQSIDASDNGVSLVTLNDYNIRPSDIDTVISSFLPPWGSDVSPDSTFMDAVTFAREFLLRSIERTTAKQEMKQIAETVYNEAEDKSLLVFSVPISRGSFIDHEDVKVVVCAANKENTRWEAGGVPVASGSFQPRIEFPATWAGLENDELIAVCGITDALFCHKNRHLFIAKSQQGAVAAARIAIAESK